MLTGGAFGYMADYVLWWVLLLSLLVHAWCFFKFFPWKRFKKTGLVMGNALVLGCLLGIAAIAGESYLRFVCVRTDAFGVSLPARRWFALHTKLNSLGCRDIEWTRLKPPGVRRIAFVGDSLTYGWGIERIEDRFPDRIGKMFESRPAGAVEVMNVAKPGWDTSVQIGAIRRMIDVYEVDEVVLCYLPNDIEKLLPTTEDFNPTRPPEPTLFNPDSSCLLDYLYRRLYLPRVATVRGYHDWLAAGYASEDIWMRHQGQLSEIIRLCADNDVTFRVLLLPFLQTTGEGLQSDRLHAVLEKFLMVNKVEVLDLLPAIAGHQPQELMVNRGDPHPNETAHRLFADAIWRAFYAAR